MAAAEGIFEFGRFRLDGTTRVLSDGGAPVALSSRAFDILHFLIVHRDRTVTKDEIIARVWQGMTVDDNNLAVQISSLRRALSDHDENAPLILTIPGRGYRFVGKIADEAAKDVTTSIAVAATGRTRSRIWLLGLALLTVLVVGYLSYRVMPWFGMNTADRTAKTPPRLSIVVMPFRNLGTDPADGYLADAVSDDLTTDLSH